MLFGHKQLYIDGELIDASNGEIFEVICPGDSSVVATISWATTRDTERALISSQKGFEFWSTLPMNERLSWINKLRLKIIEKRDLLRETIMFEMGKIWEGTDEDLTSIINSLQYYSEEIQNITDIPIPDKEGTHSHRIISQPLGVTVAFLAYNFPLLNLGFKLGPALAAGCSIIIKPSEFSPLSAYTIGEICHEISFPKGVINVLCGDVPRVGIPLCESKIPKLITLIGSTETAQNLIQQSAKTSIKRYSMECGGNAPFIVFDDADLEVAISHAAALKVGNTGQICVAPNRILVQESVIDEFIQGVLEKFKTTKVGFGRENNPDMGPLANKQSVIKVHNIVKKALDQGGQLIFGGAPINRKGCYFQPTIIRINNPNAEILKEEIFGPVAMIVPFTNKSEAIQIANNTDAGLASYVYSSDEEKLSEFTEKLEFGEVHLNGLKFDIYLPHGGIKNSGIGVDCSPYALDDYLIRKRVTRAL